MTLCKKLEVEEAYVERYNQRLFFSPCRFVATFFLNKAQAICSLTEKYTP